MLAPCKLMRYYDEPTHRKPMKFSKLDDGEEFEYEGERFEKNRVPPSMRGIVENAISLEDYTGAMFDSDDEVEPVSR